MLLASRRGASAPASASCAKFWRSAAIGTHHTSGLFNTVDFSRGGISSQNLSTNFSRYVSLAHVVANDDKCEEACGPLYLPALTSTPPNRCSIGRTVVGVSAPAENSGPKNSKIRLSDSRK